MQGSKSIVSKQAEIHESAKIGQNVIIGPWAFVGENVEVGDGSIIESHAIVRKNTTLGKNNHIHAYAILGGDPQHLKYQGEPSWLVVGDNNSFRESVTINRGSHLDQQTTFIGNNNNFFAGSHVGHDAKIGNNVLFTNNAVVGGHVVIGDHVILGAQVSVHQFVQIGSHSFLTHKTQVNNDILPFLLVVGLPGAPISLNSVGLRRHGFSREAIVGLKKAFRLIYRQMLSLSELKIALMDLAKEVPEVNMMLEIINTTKRGIVRKNARQSVEA